MNPIPSSRWHAFTARVAACLVLIPWGCSTGDAPGSYLDNCGELAVRSRQPGVEGATAAFVLWITDTLPGSSATPPARSAISGADLRSLRAELESPVRPGSAHIVRARNDGAIVCFRQAESGETAARVWMSIMFRGQSLSTATVVRTPDEYDIHAIIQAGIEELRNINASGTIEGAGLKSIRRLDFESYPNMSAVRAGLAGFFSPRTVETIVQSYGMYEREGVVAMPERGRISRHAWERAEIQSVMHTDAGFVVRLQVPTRDFQGVSTVDVPFVLTFDGWRIDGEIIP